MEGRDRHGGKPGIRGGHPGTSPQHPRPLCDEMRYPPVYETEDVARSGQPRLSVVSFVNPNDISHYRMLGELSPGFSFSVDDSVPQRLFDERFEASFREDLSTKPTCQKSDRESYRLWMRPIPDPHFEPDEFEMHSVTADPLELSNLAGNPDHAAGAGGAAARAGRAQAPDPAERHRAGPAVVRLTTHPPHPLRIRFQQTQTQGAE